MHSKHHPRVVAYAQVGPEVGSGHLVRQRALGKCLSAQGASFTLVQMAGTVGSDELTTHLQGSDIAIFDASTDITALLLSASERGVLTCALDWFGEVRPHIAFTIYPHGRTDGTALSRMGAELIVVREEVQIERWTPMPRPDFDVVICLGSADVNGETHILAETLAEQGLRVAGIFGPLALRPPATVAYRQIFDPAAVGRLLRSGAVAVTNGGTCMFEALTLGLCCLALPQTPAEATVATWLGIPRITADGVPVAGELPSGAFIRGMAPSSMVQESFDGLGAERMADAIIAFWRGASA